MKKSWYHHIELEEFVTESEALDIALGVNWDQIKTFELDMSFIRYVGTRNNVDVYYSWNTGRYLYSPCETIKETVN